MQQPARILLLDRRLPSLAAFVPACTFHTDRFHGVAQADARRPCSFATKRRASAIDVKAGWEQFEVGKTALPTIYRDWKRHGRGNRYRPHRRWGIRSSARHRYGDTIRPILREMRPLPG